MNESTLTPAQVDEIEAELRINLWPTAGQVFALIATARAQQEQINALQENLDNLLEMLNDPDGPR